MSMRFTMRVKSHGQWLGRGLIVAAGLFAAHAAPNAVLAQQTSVSGRLTSIWEDPLPERGTPRLRHFLSRHTGEMVPLRVSESQLRAVGGVEGSTGQYVEVTGSWRGPRRTPGASADRELEVNSIRYSIDALGASPPAQAAPITGSHPWITVLCRFSDVSTERHPLSWYQDLMGGTEPGVDHYWRELSYDQANVAGSGALGWYDLPQPHSYYVNESTGVSDLQLLKEDCAAAADADIYYPDYVGINLQFNADLAGFSWGGGSTLDLDLTPPQTKFYRMTWMSDWADHVTYTHEMGHGFGLPHSSGPYGAVYDSKWDVMSGAWTNYDPFWGWLAPHTISYHKEMLGWIPSDRIYDARVGLDQTIKLHRLADLGIGGAYLMARIPRPDGTFYTVEARQFEGYDVNLPAEAVIMHHVTNRAFVVDSDDPADNTNPNDDGARWLPGETFSDTASGITVTVDSVAGESFVITISLLGPPHIVLEPASLSFNAWQGGDPAPQTFIIGNSGTEELLWTISDDAEWLELGEGSGTAAASGSSAISATVSVGGLAPGTYAATITVSGNTDNSPRTAAVELVIAARPELAAQQVADQLMGVSTTLSAAELEYLDDIGNRNGGFDVGDFRAWLQVEGLMSRVGPKAGEEVAP